jgi:hypothetical protein
MARPVGNNNSAERSRSHYDLNGKCSEKSSGNKRSPLSIRPRTHRGRYLQEIRLSINRGAFVVACEKTPVFNLSLPYIFPNVCPEPVLANVQLLV